VLFRSDMVFGIKVDRVNNVVSVDPQLPESLKTGCGKIEYSSTLYSNKNKPSKFTLTMDTENQKLSVDFGSSLTKKPRVESKSYPLA